ncbi:cation diffusion facilitator family transporter [Methylocapsa sp. S129]|uniref:cation diffusion facilitator family transporter n=1 Tax=Methylocapsa sp. S129 TaxID=1641869 RepID=UPI00131D2974|nr:cation diffusion facilitator family transporter [Methylocapsa sp. S129]
MVHNHHHDDHGHDHHDHGHSHGHAHVHAPKNFGPAFAIGVALNLGFVIAEAVYGLLANSIALVADAGHNLGDVLGLAMAWTAMALARRAPSQTLTYGLRRGTILAALMNAVLLLVTVGAIGVEGVRRLFEPAAVAGVTVMAVAAAGIVVNGVTAWLFASGRKGDINLRGAFLHMASDALVSLGVVIAGAIILTTGWTWLDPLVSIVIAILILWGTWGLLRDSLAMALDAVPANIKLDEVRAFLERQPGVAGIHDLHIWPMSTTETALTCHCLLPGGHPGDEFLVRLAHELEARFAIGHATIQVEVNAHVACALEPDRVV